MKVIIVGGVAGGASCAARLRRLDEKAEILMVERGPYVSYANCGLPYHISGVIPQESSLLVANEQVFRALFLKRIRGFFPNQRRIRELLHEHARDEGLRGKIRHSDGGFIAFGEGVGSRFGLHSLDKVRRLADSFNGELDFGVIDIEHIFSFTYSL